MNPASPTFRVFVSSTFADLVAERTALQESVFPRLRKLCAQYGARFAPVDLRWGVSAEASQDRRTMAICLGEIRRCQQTTARPNFIVLIGGRYGWRPLPAEIAAADFAELRATEAIRPRLSRFESLYSTVDRNAVPPVHCLSAAGQAEGAVRDDELPDALAAASADAGWSFARRAPFGGSATEQEIVCGLLDDSVLPAARDHVHAFVTNVRGREDDRRLGALKDRLRETLGVNVHEYDAVDGDADAARRVQRLCEDVYTALASTIAMEAESFTRVEPLDREIRAHEAFASDRERVFVGRTDILDRVKGYLAGDGGKVLAIVGPPGSGKSSVMARALGQARAAHPGAVVASRFIGATPDSSSGVTLLHTLSAHLARSYGAAAPAAYADYPRIAAVFRESLALARGDRPLILFLDALDQLPGFDAAAGLSWLPLTELPPYVHVVTSASTDARDMVTALQQKLGANAPYLEPMPTGEASDLLDMWLAAARRTVQPEQRDALIAGYARSGLPLYLRLAFEEANRWRSFDPPVSLGEDALAVIRGTFARLSAPANHGVTLVRSSLAYLTAAKEGLSEDEIVDVLSRDDEVMASFRARFPNSPGTDRLPLVIWSRLYYDLQPYLTERAGAGGAVLDFFHRQMRRVAASDYLDPASEHERHRALADYFQSQSNMLAPGVHNGRQLAELPFQLRKAGMWEDLEATLCDLAFIEAKCAAGLIYDLIADYQAALLTADLPAGARERIQSFGRFVRAQAHLLSTRPHLTFQQALNEPDSTGPAQAAARLAMSDDRPRLRRVGKSQQPSLCDQTLYGHTSYVNGCDVSPDDRRIASASSDGEIKIWDAQTGQEMLRLRGPAVSVESCQFSPDGGRLVAASRDGEVTLWDAAAGGSMWRVKHHDRPVPCCRFSHDGRRIVTASWDGSVKVLDAATGAELLAIDAHEGDACWAEFSNDDGSVISCGGDGRLAWWNASTGMAVKAVKAHDSEIMSCRLSRDGRYVLTVSQDRQVKRWDAESLELLGTYDGHTSGVWAAAVSPDGQMLATGGGDGCIKFWQADTGIELASTTDHTNEVWGLAFFEGGTRAVSAAWDNTVRLWNVGRLMPDVAGERQETANDTRLWGYMIACCCAPDGTSIAAGSQDGSVRLWDATTGRPQGIFPIHRDFVFACAYSPDSRWLVSGAWDGAIQVLDVRERRVSARESLATTVVYCAFTADGSRMVAASTKEVGVWDFREGRLEARTLWAVPEAVSGCAVLPDGAHVVTGHDGGRLRFWHVDSATVTGELPGHPGLVMLSVSRDGQRLATTSEQGHIRIWDLARRVEVATLQAHRERVVACNFSPDGDRLVSGSWDGTARIWDLHSASASIVLEGHLDQLQDCCFTPAGSRVLTASVDGTVRLWDARDGVALGELLSPADAASVCAMSADGGLVASASSRHAIQVWSGASGERGRMLSGHDDAVRACVFLPDGRLVSAAADGTLRLWSADGAAAEAILGTHDGPVSSCDVSPDGRWIVSGGNDRRVRIWEVETRREIARLAGHDDWVPVVLSLPDGRRAVSCSLDRTARIWDVPTRRVLHVLTGHAAALSAAAASHDGSRLITGGGDGGLMVWDAETGARQLALSGHLGAITGCAFAGPIVSASRDGTLRLWDAVTGEARAEMKGHSRPVHACAVSPDRRYVASAAEDSFAVLWDTSTGEQRAEYWVGAPALSIAWDPTRRRIAVGDVRGNLHLLDLEGRVG